jgi:class 3 adenylate cyclase
MTATCETCGNPLPPDAHFCPNCGAPVSAADTVGERRLVTVLFADLVGSTELSRRLDAERSREVLNAYFNAVATEISAARGQLEKFIGDAVMAVFGVPRVHEDDAIRAVRSGLAIVDRVARLGRAADSDPGLEVRVGIESGEAATGIGPAGQLLVTGTVVNAAARLQAAGRPAEVLIGETTRLLIRGAARVGEVRSVEAKGFGARGLLAYPVEALERSSVRRTIPLVGRATELTLMRQAFERTAQSGRPHLVTVIGEAGMGKSRLVEEFVALLPDTVEPLVGRADVYGGPTVLGPVADMLRKLGGIADGESPDGVMRRLADAVASRCQVDDPAGLASRLALVLGVVSGARRDEAGLVHDAQHAFRSLVNALSAHGPVVVVVDDLHLARAPVQDLVERLTSRKRGAPRLLVAVTARQDLIDERPSWGSGAHNHALIRLDPLADDDSADLARQAGGGRLGEGTSRHIAERAGGNPFFIIETTGMLLDAAPVEVDTAALPPTVQAVVAARLDRLPVAPRCSSTTSTSTSLHSLPTRARTRCASWRTPRYSRSKTASDAGGSGIASSTTSPTRAWPSASGCDSTFWSPMACKRHIAMATPTISSARRRPRSTSTHSTDRWPTVLSTR